MAENKLTEMLDSKEAPAVHDAENETELIRWVMDLQEDAAKRRKKDANEENWDDWEQGFWGENHWPAVMPSYKPAIVVNTLKTRMLQEISDLTEQPIKIYVTKDPKTGQRDELVEKALQAYWHRQHMDYQIMLAVYHASILPCGFIKCFWDKDGDHGQGKIDTGIVHPGCVYPDPDSPDDEQWRYVNLLEVMDVTEIQRLWPVSGMAIKPDDDYSIKNTGTLWNKMTSALAGGFAKYRGPLYDKGGGGIPQGYIKARAAVISCFVYDDEEEEKIEEITNPTTGEASLKSTIRQKYPNGRLIQIANDSLLFDGPNPYWGRFPLTRFTVQLHDTFWPPCSLVGDVLEIYKAANKLDAAVVENAIRLNSGKVIADANSGIKPGRFTNSPAEVLLKTPGTNVEIKYPPPMPADMVQGGQRLRGYGDEVLGYPASRTGGGQGGNVAAELVETEIGQAQGLSRLRGRLLHMSVEKVVQMILSRMAQFYRTPRMIPYISGSQWSPIQWDPTQMAEPKDYQAHLDPASFEVRSKTMMQRLYLTLGKAGYLAPLDVMKMLEIPDAEAKAQRLSQHLQQVAASKKSSKDKHIKEVTRTNDGFTIKERVEEAGGQQSV